MGYETTAREGIDYFVYTCPHTGERFQGPTLELAKKAAIECSPNCNGVLTPTTISVLTGGPSEQKGSQFWMDANKTGIMPVVPIDVKSALSTADYARDWMGEYAKSVKQVNSSPALLAMQKYPTTESTAELWVAIPELRPGSLSVNYNTPTSSPGSTNSSVLTGGVVAVEGVKDTISSIVGRYGTWIIGGIVIAVLLVLVSTGAGRRFGVTS